MIKLEDLANIKDPQIRIDRYMEFQDGKIVKADDPDIMLLFNYDPVESEDGLTNWAERHNDACSILSTYPLVLKIFGHDPNDRENRNIHFKRKKGREYAIRKSVERKEWDAL